MKHIKVTYKKAVVFIFIGILMNFFIFLKIKNNLSHSQNILNLFVQAYGNLNLQSDEWIRPIMLLLIHPIYLLCILGDYIYIQSKEYGVHIFTRNTSKKQWFISNAKNLLVYILIYYIFQFLTMFLFGELYGFKIFDSRNFFIGISICLFFSIISVYLLLIFCNVLSLYFDEVYSYFISISSIVYNMFLSFTIFKEKFNFNIIKFLPFSQGILGWHNWNLMDRNIHSFNFFINNYSIYFSIVYTFLFLSCLFLIGIKRINTMDIL